MKVTPHISLVFGGQCEAAFRCYAQNLNGRITFMLTWGSSPMAADPPPGWEAKIAHATLIIGETVIIGGDVPPDQYRRPQGFEIVLDMDDALEAERIFQAFADDGTVVLPLQETFWASRFGVVIDRFGIPWSINCDGNGASV